MCRGTSDKVLALRRHRLAEDFCSVLVLRGMGTQRFRAIHDAAMSVLELEFHETLGLGKEVSRLFKLCQQSGFRNKLLFESFT
jgi:hypothetical protein